MRPPAFASSLKSTTAGSATTDGDAIDQMRGCLRRPANVVGPGESNERHGLAYRHAIEDEGHPYVDYSNSGVNGGRVGRARQQLNDNSAALAVIPLESPRELVTP